MKFKCLNEKCGKTFVYAAKKTISRSSAFSEDFSGIYPEQIETRHCPYCQQMDFEEYTEPKDPELKPTRTQEAKWGSQTNSLIEQGYEVIKSLSSRTGAVLFKYSMDKQNPPEVT